MKIIEEKIHYQDKTYYEMKSYIKLAVGFFVIRKIKLFGEMKYNLK